MASESRPTVIAHRGASGYRPEHTRSAFELAIALGADAVEPDLVASRDGVLVVRHENEISQTTDVADRGEFAHRRATKKIDGARVTGWFTEDFTWAELSTLRTRERLPQLRPDNTAYDLREPMLRLEDLLAILDGANREVGLVAEVKHAAYFASIGLRLPGLLAEVLAAAGWRDRARLTVESFELSALTELRDLGLAARLVYLLEADGAPADRPWVPYAESLTASGLERLARDVHGVSVDKKVLLRADADAAGVVGRVHDAGLLAYCWTLRPENRFLAPRFRSGRNAAARGAWREEFDLVLGSGVDGVFADHPDLALAAIGAGR